MKKHYKADNVEEYVSNVGEILCQIDCEQVLNQLVLVQSWHHALEFQSIKGLELNRGEPVISNQADRNLLTAKFPKHVKEIFSHLTDLRNDGNFVGFMEHLQDNIKNLGAHLRLLDKKSEKSLIAKLKHELHEIQDASLFKKLSYIQLLECNNNFSGFKDNKSKKVLDK